MGDEGFESPDLCRVKAIQGKFATGENARTYALTCTINRPVKTTSDPL